jgi:hypothetical protein
MKTLPLLLFVLLAGLPRLQAGEASLTEAEATAAARNWASLVKSAETAELERLLNENYLHTHGTGKVETKTQFLEALRGGTRKYERCEMSDLRVILLGPGAVVQGNLDVKAVTKDKTLEVINRFMLVMERTGRGLSVVAFQATPTEKK